MELDLEGKHADRACPMVTPRPIAWVTTLGPDGVVNAAPFSFFNVLGDEPPIIGSCPGDRDDRTPKDTARNTESPASLECQEWSTLQIGNNRLIIGLVKRVQVFRIRSEKLNVIGRMAVPHGYCRTRDRFETHRAE